MRYIPGDISYYTWITHEDAYYYISRDIYTYRYCCSLCMRELYVISYIYKYVHVQDIDIISEYYVVYTRVYWIIYCT